MFNLISKKAICNYFWLSKILHKELLVNIIPHEYYSEVLYKNIQIGRITQNNDIYRQIYNIRLFGSIHKVAIDIGDITLLARTINNMDTLETLVKRRISDVFRHFNAWVKYGN